MIEETQGVILFADVVDFVAKDKTLPLIAVHAAHQSLVFVNVPPNRTEWIRRSWHLTVGLDTHVTGHVHDHAGTDLWTTCHLRVDRCLQHEQQAGRDEHRQ